MKHLRLSLTILAAGILLPACKSSNPEFGIPDEPKAKPLGGVFSGEGKSIAERRHDWKINERKKSKQMFDRMRDEY